MRALTELSFFVVVAEEGGFTAAAQVLGVSRSYVSRVVAALEARLGAPPAAALHAGRDPDRSGA